MPRVSPVMALNGPTVQIGTSPLFAEDRKSRFVSFRAWAAVDEAIL
jgi:hypothetical protein